MTAADMTSGYALPLGTLEQARALVGSRTPPRVATAEVSRGRIQQFCAMTRDDNPGYWATSPLAPPAMLLTWLMPLEWSPSAPAPEPMLMARIPLPGTSMVNRSNDTTYHLPVHVGDLLTVEEELVSVSDRKSTRLGDGHFVETLAVFRNQHGAVVAEARNVLFRFTPREPS